MKNIFHGIRLFIVIILILSLYGCENSTEPDQNVKYGELEITISTTNYSGYYPSVLKGAKVIIKGIDSVFTTDSYGKIYFSSMRTGTYEITAFCEKIGSAVERVKVEEGVFTKITLTLIPTVLFEPTIRGSNNYYDSFSVEDTLNFKFVITDNITPSEKIDVEISDNFEGRLFKGNPSRSGDVSVNFFSKKKGIHVLRITAKDGDGYIGNDSVVVYYTRPQKPIITSVTVNSGVRLTWTKCNDSTFSYYEVSQSNSDSYYYNMVQRIDNRDSVTYYDPAPPMVDSIFYKIVAYNQEGQKSESKYVKITNPCGAIYNYQIKNGVIHPTLPYLYFTTIDNKLVMLNYETQKIVKSLVLLSSPGMMDIGDNGLGIELYVPESSGMINIYDPLTLNKISSINCNAQLTSAAIDGRKHIIVGVSILSAFAEAVRSYDRVTGNFISAAGTLYAPIVKMFPDRKKFMGPAIDKYSSMPSLEYYELGDDGNFTTTKTPPNQNYSGMSPSTFKISPNGKFAVTGGDGMILNKESLFNYSLKLGGMGYYFSDFEFDNSGEYIYGAVPYSKKISVYKYYSNQIINSFSTKQSPYLLFAKGSNLIVISKPTSDYSYSNRFIIEIISAVKK